MLSSYLFHSGSLYILSKLLVLALVLILWFTIKSYPVI
ncbi:hypothetical protein Lepto7376_0152 [[Leptolyngbya] sp. PCC 7376]|nr:hypothetical protein Lepto7376_0152 [[Leptolyngbya] sp. PCC 7376]